MIPRRRKVMERKQSVLEDTVLSYLVVFLNSILICFSFGPFYSLQVLEEMKKEAEARG